MERGPRGPAPAFLETPADSFNRRKVYWKTISQVRMSAEAENERRQDEVNGLVVARADVIVRADVVVRADVRNDAVGQDVRRRVRVVGQGVRHRSVRVDGVNLEPTTRAAAIDCPRVGQSVRHGRSVCFGGRAGRRRESRRVIVLSDDRRVVVLVGHDGSKTDDEPLFIGRHDHPCVQCTRREDDRVGGRRGNFHGRDERRRGRRVRFGDADAIHGARGGRRGPHDQEESGEQGESSEQVLGHGRNRLCAHLGLVTKKGRSAYHAL